MHLYPYQRLYFSTLEYDALKPVFTKEHGMKALSDMKEYHTLLLTGIGSPKQLEHDLSPVIADITPMTFSDHHQFRKKDVALINETFEAMPSPKCIITTEKDVTRLKCADGLSDEVRKNIYMLPVRIVFMQDQEQTFNQQIIGYVRKNSRNSILAKGKGENKSDDSDYSGNRPRTISFRNN
jgi:tetraacyldisaccharide 4'-kinase